MATTADDGEHIRAYYGVPAKVGCHITFGDYGGVVDGFDGDHLLALVDCYEDEPRRMRLHPASVEYFPRADQVEPGMVVRNPVRVGGQPEILDVLRVEPLPPPDNGLVLIHAAEGSVRVASGWPVEPYTTAQADLEATLVMSEAGRLGIGRLDEQTTEVEAHDVADHDADGM